MSIQLDTSESIQRIESWVVEYWWLLLIGCSVAFFAGLGLYLIWEAQYFAMDRAFQFAERAREVESAEERAEFMLAASGSWGIATANSAIAAGLLSLASIQIGVAALLYSVKQDSVSKLYVIEAEALDETIDEQVNHKLSEFVGEDR